MDELQNIWDAHQDKVGKEQHLDEFEIKQQLKGKTNDALREINKIMRVDVIIMAIVTGLFIMVTFILNLESRYTISMILFGMMTVLGAHYWMKHYLINKHDLDTDNIADIITKKLKYLKWNKHIYIYGIPVFFFGLYLYFQNVWAQVIPNVAAWHIYTLGLLLTGFVFISSKRLHKFLYGKEIKVLEDIIDQLA